jgi:hypothetical protein
MGERVLAACSHGPTGHLMKAMNGPAGPGAKGEQQRLNKTSRLACCSHGPVGRSKKEIDRPQTCSYKLEPRRKSLDVDPLV